MPLGTHKVQLSASRLVTVSTEETIEQGPEEDGEVLRRGAPGGHRRGDGRARGAHQEGGGPDAHSHRGGAARPRHAGRHAQGGAEPAGRGALGARLGRAHRVGLGAAPTPASTSTASRSRRSTTWAACARRSTPTWCGRSICCPAATAPSTAAASAAWCASRRAQLPQNGVHGYVAADVLDASAMLTATLSPKRAHRPRRPLQLPRSPARARHVAEHRRLLPHPALRRLPGDVTPPRARTRSSTSSFSRRTITCAARSRRAIRPRCARRTTTRASIAASSATRGFCPTAPASWSRRRSATTPRRRPRSSARCRRRPRRTPGATACAARIGASWRAA